MLRRALVIGFALVNVSCGDALSVTCPSDPALWVVQPDSINIAAGDQVRIEVTESTCGKTRFEKVFPPMTILDTAIAYADQTHRMVLGGAKGVTTLVLTSDGRNGASTKQIPVVVR